MEKNEDLIKIIANMSEPERQALIESLSKPTEEPPKKQKFRRKKNGGGDNTSTPSSSDKRKIKRLTKGGNPTDHAGKVQASLQKFQVGPRPNKFEQSSVFHADKHLIEEDKRNWKNINPTPREREVAIYEVECNRCGKTCEAKENEIFFSGPDEYSFYCDKCGGRR